MTPATTRLPISSGQMATLIAAGIIFWFIGALICRWVGAIGAFDGANRALLYAALVPGTLPVILLVRRAARLAPDQVALGSAIVTAAAIACDSIALVVIPDLYGAGVEQAAASGAVILWGGAVAIALGCWLNRAPARS